MTTDRAAFLSVVVRSTVKGNGVRIGLEWTDCVGDRGGEVRVRHHRESVRVLLQSPVRRPSVSD